jgi:hypothetical protein
MDEKQERRREERLQYQWPVWFADDFEKTISQGLMVDISSGGIAFTCKRDRDYPQTGQRLMIRFSIPRFDQTDRAASVSFTRSGRICRVDMVRPLLYRIAVQFDQPLTLKPAEQASIELIHIKNTDNDSFTEH